MSRGLSLCLLLLFAACDDPNEVAAPPSTAGPSAAGPGRVVAGAAAGATPAPIVFVGGVGFWPFSSENLFAEPQDPINLVFVGKADPRALRAALLMLGGNRAPYFPDVFPFNCTWQDAIGGVQAAYGSSSGWVGSAIQLACGPYDPVRFHLRFFDVGGATLAGAHFEALIPGTTEHQVLSWELAEQLVTVDFLRSGLLDLAAPFLPSDGINDAPSYRKIPAVIYNGLPDALKEAIGRPPADANGDVGIPSDGRPTVLNVAGSVEGLPMVARQQFTIAFDQVIPKPFCAAGAYDFLLVRGPVELRQQVVLTPSGNYSSEFHARGQLDLTPVDPLTGSLVGASYQARVTEHHHAVATDALTLVSSFQMQIEIPPSGPFRGRLMTQLTVGPGQASYGAIEVRCLP